MSSIERPHDPEPLSPETAASPPAPALDPRIGQRIGKYQLTRLLGAGGMGIVYAATDTVLDRAVAVKLLSKELSADPEAVRRFRREARSADGRSLAGACGYYGFTVWDYRGTSDLRNPRIHPCSGGLLLTAAFAPDGRMAGLVPANRDRAGAGETRRT